MSSRLIFLYAYDSSKPYRILRGFVQEYYKSDEIITSVACVSHAMLRIDTRCVVFIDLGRIAIGFIRTS